jgi:hypothetical protein
MAKGAYQRFRGGEGRTPSSPARLVLKNHNAMPEAEIQRHVVSMLRAYLPTGVWFTASLSGVKLTPAIAGQAKAAGMERGAPDLSFIFPDGVTRYIEMKAPGCFFTNEQAALKRVLGDDMMVARSWADVKAVLTGWMAPYGLTWLTERESLERLAAQREAARK